MEDKTTPHLQPDGHQMVLTGSDFLAGREAHLQARLDELDAELAALGDVPDDVESLERQALDALRALSDLLDPPQPAAAPAPAVETMPAPLPASDALPERRRVARHRRAWLVVGIVLVLAITTLAVILIAWTVGPKLPGREDGPTAVVLATVTHTALPPTGTTFRPTRTPATATPIPSPTVMVPQPVGAGPDVPIQIREAVQAEAVQILDVTGTLRLELPLSLMAVSVKGGEGVPVLQPVLPTSGAGVFPGSTPFGERGDLLAAVPREAAPAGVWQVRPGDRLAGCNSDGACHDYRVTTAGTWPLERLQQMLPGVVSHAATDRLVSGTVLLYTPFDESSAWVVEARLQHEEERR